MLNNAAPALLVNLADADDYAEQLELGLPYNRPAENSKDAELFTASALTINAAEAAYCVRYNQLNRKLRKIVKNKYRYQKRFEWIPPALRPYTAIRLFKAYLKTRTELTLAERFAGVLTDQLLFADKAPLTQLAKQSQQTAVSALSQTANIK